MDKLAISDLMKLEEYAERRPAFRRSVLEHKRPRKLHLGDHLVLLFEDRLTVQYQIQEMLRIERIFERAGIQEELDAYNPLIPDGRNWKATLQIEFADPAERARQLELLRGVERTIWVQVGDLPRSAAVADEDLEREDDAKTSAVHFLRFEVAGEAARRLRDGAALLVGVTHPHLQVAVEATAETRRALLADLD